MKTLLISTLFILLTGCFFDRQDPKSINLKGFNFSLADIEGECSVRRLGDSDNLVLKCSAKKLQPVSQSCEGFITGGLRQTQLNCSGSLWVVRDHCEIKMRSSHGGELFCRA